MVKKFLWAILICSILFGIMEVFAFGHGGHGGGGSSHGGGHAGHYGGTFHGGGYSGHHHGGHTSSLLDYRYSCGGGGYSGYGYSPRFLNSGCGGGYYSSSGNYNSGCGSGGGFLSFLFSLGSNCGGSNYSRPFYQPMYGYQNMCYRNMWGQWVYGPVLVQIR